MKLLMYVFLIPISFAGFAVECPPFQVELLSKDLSMRQSQLQDAMDECPNIVDAIKLAQVFQQLDKSDTANEVMLDALNDVIKSDTDRAQWLMGSIDMALKENSTCQASKYLNELSYLTGFENDHSIYRKKLYSNTKNKILNSQTIGCALAESRSVSFRGMKIKPKIDLAIHFDFNSDQLTQKGKEQSQQLAKALNMGKLKMSKLLLIGHTDKVGSDAYNLDLSQRRSLSVKNYLLTIDSVFSSRISTNGMGESQLLSQGTTDSDHQLNRRVEIQIQ